MKASEMIAALQAAVNKRGDLEVTVTDGFQTVFYRGAYTITEFQEDDNTWVLDIGIGGCEEQPT